MISLLLNSIVLALPHTTEWKAADIDILLCLLILWRTDYSTTQCIGVKVYL